MMFGEAEPQEEEQKQESALEAVENANSTLLEAAFVDPAYSWPPQEGMGKNAIELQASSALLADADDASILTTDSQKERMTLPTKPEPQSKSSGFLCCKSIDAVVDPEEQKEYERQKKAAMKARQEHKATKKTQARQKRKEGRFTSVPEGILLYRLDTAARKIELMSDPGSNTNMETLLTELKIKKSYPSNDVSRRGIILEGIDGTRHTLVACEQRTAIAWLEAMDMNNQKSRNWSEQQDATQRFQNEHDYLGLAAYSNKLIRAGASADKSSPKTGKKTKKGGAGGIYYNVQFQSEDGSPYPPEALESLAKRRAVIKDSWDFYRMICSLLRDRRKYDEVFRQMQMDPVYPYLNSMTGLNDPGDGGVDTKTVIQKDISEYNSMTKTAVAGALVQQAEAALPSLVEICKALAGSLGMEEVGVGPIKEVAAALRKAEKKYDGDLLKVTDYCRALLVVKDFPSLLALLELARDSFGPLIRRVKLSTLKKGHRPLQGGYRDCKINVELKDHICEIQVHIWPLWNICGVDGFRHYRHCLEYSTDSFDDPYDALDGLDRKTVAELIIMAEEAVSEMPLQNLEWNQEKHILDYFAEVGLFMKHGLDVWAEVTLKQLIKLRCESPDIGPEHHETFILYNYHEQVLKNSGNKKEAAEVAQKIKQKKVRVKQEETEAEEGLWDSFLNAPSEAYDTLFDPNRKERQEEENLRKEVKASKKIWRKIRQERFTFLNSAQSVP